MAYALLWSAGRSLETCTSVPSPALTCSFSKSLKSPHKTPKRQRVVDSCSHFPDSVLCAAPTFGFPGECLPRGSAFQKHLSS